MRSESSSLDRTLAKICELCLVCLHARYRQKGVVFEFVRNVEQEICPFCKAYERVRLHQDQDDPAIFVFYENWKSLACLEQHMKSQHFQAYITAVEGMIADKAVHKMAKIAG